MSDGTTTWTYTYDANGMRTSRSDGTTTYNYVYNGSKLTQMTVGSKTLYFTYGVDGSPLAVTFNNVVYFYVTNLQGDVIGIQNTAGVMAAVYYYDAWGNILGIDGTMADTLGVLNPLTYRAYVFDHDTGLYYLQSRYYNPQWGRFLNADVYTSTGQGLLGNNMFVYCLNNPVRHSDSTGTRVDIWPILFEEHDPGYIHRAVQAHIVGTGLIFKKELVLPGVGRADIYNPDTGEIWEIKHGGSTAYMQEDRAAAALSQVTMYINEYTKLELCLGAADAFTGQFAINCNNISYLVSYDTPQAGVILYYVKQLKKYEPEAYKVRLPATATIPHAEIAASVGAYAFLALALVGGVGCPMEKTFQEGFAP